MTEAFTIDVDPAGFVTIRMGGFFSPGAFDRLHAALREAYGRLRCARNSHVVLVDVSACGLQPQHVVERIRDLLRPNAHSSRRTAIVTGQSLMRMQIRRLMGTRPGLEMFDTVEEAECWLRSPSGRAAA